MNGRNRHMKYRKSVYRRRRIRTVIITLAIALVILIAAFLIIGNLLTKRSNERNQGKENPVESTQADVGGEKPPIRGVQAYPVLLETEDSSDFASRLEALKKMGANSASVPLNTKSGTLLYRSPVAIGLGLQAADARSVTVSAAMAKAAGTGIYVSGVYYLNVFDEEDDLLRSVQLSHAAAILAEALRGGLNDVLLIVPDLTEEHTAEILRLMENVRGLYPQAVLGLTVPHSVASSERGASVIERLYEGVDYLALNAAEYGEADPVTYVEQTVSDGGMRYYLLRYGMRVLIPTGSEVSSEADLIAAVTDNGIQNWQIIQ